MLAGLLTFINNVFSLADPPIQRPYWPVRPSHHIFWALRKVGGSTCFTLGSQTLRTVSVLTSCSLTVSLPLCLPLSSPTLTWLSNTALSQDYDAIDPIAGLEARVRAMVDLHGLRRWHESQTARVPLYLHHQAWHTWCTSIRSGRFIARVDSIFRTHLHTRPSSVVAISRKGAERNGTKV